MCKDQPTLLRIKGHIEQRHTTSAGPSLVSQDQHTQQLVKGVAVSPAGIKRLTQLSSGQTANLWNHELS